VTAFLWFGTILSVHLILKPAYAAKGLPRGELRLGWAGIVSMGVTGTILSLMRIDSWHSLFGTRFGVLLCVKIGLFLVMAATALLVTFVIGPRLGKKRGRAPHPGRGVFTPGDLEQFDGREGRRALVAVQGRVHDLAGGEVAGGSHFQRHAAERPDRGLAQAPHGGKLAAFPAVGTLASSADDRPAPHERGFFFMAYLNLGIVIAILSVITLWRL
jgi:predicted heme/steroid binding protein